MTARDILAMPLDEAERAKWDPANADDNPQEYSYDDEQAEATPENSADFVPAEPDDGINTVDDALKAVDRKLAYQKKRDAPAPASTDETDEADTVDPVEDRAPEPEETTDVDEDLLARARDAGLSDDDISEFTEAQLEKALTLYDRKLIKGELEPAEPEPEEEVIAEEPPVEFDPKDYGLDPEFGDPAVIEAFKKLHEKGQDASKRMSQEIGGLKDHIRNQAREAFQGRFDSFVNELPKEYQELLGEGPTADLMEESSEFQLRKDVADTANALAKQLMEQPGKPLPSEKKLLKRAMYAVLAEQATEIEKKRATKEAKKRKSRTSAPPSARRQKDDRARKGDQAARDWVHQFARDEQLDQRIVDGIDVAYAEGI